MTDEHVAAILPKGSGDLLVLPSGEIHKRWDSVEKIIEQALDLGLGRDAVFMGIGGGVICDMTAFAASIYMRGVAVDLVPTSLLAMVDASLGGKTGTDFRKVKNIIGTFHPADKVYICSDALASLPEDEYRNGLAELIKHAFLQGGRLIETIVQLREVLLSRSDPRLLEDLIIQSILVKKSFIESDPTERNDLRVKLNFGHTFGHALETTAELSAWSHGEAVAWGMARAVEAGLVLGETDEAYAQLVKDTLRAYGFRIDYKIPADLLDHYIETISHDKKKQKGVVRFVLQHKLGDTFLRTLDTEIIKEVISSSQRW